MIYDYTITTGNGEKLNLAAYRGKIIMEGRPATVHILTKLAAQVTGETFPFYKLTCTPMRMKREDFHPL